MTAEKKLNALLDFIRMKVDVYRMNESEYREDVRNAVAAHNYVMAEIKEGDAYRNRALAEFGTDLLEYVEILERESALQQMRIASAACNEQ